MLNLIKPYYNEPHRHYHNMDHIKFMLDFGKEVGLTENQEIAILFHDIVYIAGEKDNESKSVVLMRQLLHDSNFDLDTISSIILDTVDHRPSIEESKLVLDLDFLAIALDYELFEQNSNDIRKEFNFISDWDYRAGRIKFLTELLERDTIFHTDGFKEFNLQAYKNINKGIGDLLNTSI